MNELPPVITAPPLSIERQGFLVAEITLREVYDLLLELRTNLNGVPDTVKDHEVRLRVIEKRMWQLAGAAAVLGTLGGNLLERITSASASGGP